MDITGCINFWGKLIHYFRIYRIFLPCTRIAGINYSGVYQKLVIPLHLLRSVQQQVMTSAGNSGLKHHWLNSNSGAGRQAHWPTHQALSTPSPVTHVPQHVGFCPWTYCLKDIKCSHSSVQREEEAKRSCPSTHNLFYQEEKSFPEFPFELIH